MRMKKVERLGIRPISEFELEGIMFKKLGEERLDKEKLEIKFPALKGGVFRSWLNEIGLCFYYPVSEYI